MTETPSLLLPAAIEAELRRHLESCYPEEGCALLIGTEQAGEGTDPPCLVVTRLVPAPNIDPAPRRAFELDPRAQFAWLRRLRQQAAQPGASGERLLGHAHSHPDGPAAPSERDRAQSWEPGLVWIVVAVEQGKAGRFGAWMAARDTKNGAADFHPMRLRRDQDLAALGDKAETQGG